MFILGAEKMESEKRELLTVSKERVADHGEVYTGGREVNAMLDLVKSETERIDSRFLEPACGNGNFLSEILERKLRVVEKRYKKSHLDYERYAVLAVSSIYGIDILPDNVKNCRQRLFDIFEQNYTRLFKKKAKKRCREAVRFILGKNIIWGDALTLKTKDDELRPIIFAEWALISGSKFKRRDFAFHDLAHPDENKQLTLFNKHKGIVDRDTGDKGFIPISIKDDYPPTNFWELSNVREHEL